MRNLTSSRSSVEQFRFHLLELTVRAVLKRTRCKIIVQRHHRQVHQRFSARRRHRRHLSLPPQNGSMSVVPISRRTGRTRTVRPQLIHLCVVLHVKVPYPSLVRQRQCNRLVLVLHRHRRTWGERRV